MRYSFFHNVQEICLHSYWTFRSVFIWQLLSASSQKCLQHTRVGMFTRWHGLVAKLSSCSSSRDLWRPRSYVCRPGVDKSAYHAVACMYMKVRVQPALLLFFHVSNLHPSQSIIFSFLLQTQTVFISLEIKLNAQRN